MVFQPNDELLTAAEIRRLVQIFAHLGVDKIRLTGVEPTVHADLLTIVRNIRAAGITRISMTTNGLRLTELAVPLKQAGLERVNVSVDTLDPDRFHRVTRWGHLDKVLDGVYAAEAAGLTPVKINAVVARGFNEQDIADLARLTLSHPWQGRFIEMMPFGDVAEFAQNATISQAPTYNLPTTTPFTDKSETPTPNTIIVTSTTTIADGPSPTPSKPVYKIAFQDEAPYATSKKITVANLINLREISRLGVGKPEQADTTPNDAHTAIATSAGVIIFEGTELLKWIDPQSWATSVQFSPDGNILAIGLMTGEIQLWNWQSGTKYPASLLSHTDKINQILFSEGGLIYSASADRSIRVWDLNSRGWC